MRRAFVLTACLAAMSGAHALEGMSTYDAFSSDNVDLTRWNEVDSVREIVDGGKLRLGQRMVANNSGNSGVTQQSWGVSVKSPADVTQLAATITVQGAGNTDCAANSAGGWSGARIAGSFFNTGTRTSGSFVNDVIAQVRVRRAGTSTAADGVLDVQAVFVKCTDATCDTSTPLKTISLGTGAVDTATRVYLRWDAANHRFLVKRDAAATQSWTYTVSDTSAPGKAFKALQVRNVIENCTTGTRDGYAAALFDNVSVNTSALP